MRRSICAASRRTAATCCCNAVLARVQRSRSAASELTYLSGSSLQLKHKQSVTRHPWTSSCGGRITALPGDALGHL